VRKLKIFFLAVTVIGFVALSGGCKKTYTTVVQNKDSVFSSSWLTISDTIYTDQYGDTSYQETFSPIAALTQSIISDGVVLTYIGAASGTDTIAALAGENGLQTVYVPGSITIDSEPGDDGGAGDFTGVLFRYVIVPGYVLTTNNLTKQQAKSMSFTQITKLLSAAKTSSATSITQ
jgi:hypothetical protein